MSDNYDILVIGGGHAGCEAALASARMGCQTLLFNINLDSIALMSCNPAIGGLAKGQLVKEIDALGGEMGKITDKTAVHFRLLNASKGPAVQSSRMQCDKQLYRLTMKATVENQKNLYIRQAMVESLVIEDNEIKGVLDSERLFLWRKKSHYYHRDVSKRSGAYRHIANAIGPRRRTGLRRPGQSTQSNSALKSAG